MLHGIEIRQTDPLASVRSSPAYRAGYLMGRSGKLGLNPYSPSTMEHEYWKLGCTAGYTWTS